MQGIITNMMTVFDNMKASGSYLILLFAALYVLYRVNAKKNQWYIYYAVGSFILVCANPLLVWILSKAFPVLADYTVFGLFVPVFLYVPFAVSELYEKHRDNKQVYSMLVFLAVVIGISGNLYGFYADADTDTLRYGKAQKAVVEVVKEKQPVTVLADEDVLPFLRIKVPEVSLLYGRDLYQPGMDLGIVDVYSEELLHLYEAMKNPEDTIEDILLTADLYGCDMVIVKTFDKAPVLMGHYAKTEETGEYIIYSVQ